MLTSPCACATGARPNSIAATKARRATERAGCVTIIVASKIGVQSPGIGLRALGPPRPALVVMLIAIVKIVGVPLKRFAALRIILIRALAGDGLLGEK